MGHCPYRINFSEELGTNWNLGTLKRKNIFMRDFNQNLAPRAFKFETWLVYMGYFIINI